MLYTDLSGRRIAVVGAAVHHAPVLVVDRNGKEIGRFRSVRKFTRAIVGGDIVLIDGDVIHVGKRVVVS